MKLRKLTIANIGPYKGEHTINFDDLTSDLYLITGQTGAGKTYIFDAICYALYNKTSGERRNVSDLKSKFAGIEDEAYVKLEFDYQGVPYSVLRKPKQDVKAKKKTKDGSGITSQDPYALLEYKGVKIEKPRDVDAKLLEIIGLEFDKFKATMMIAQGDFYSLINADTSKRQEIFRKILNTEKLKDLADKLKDLLNEKESDAKLMNDRIFNLRNSLIFSDELNERLRNKDEILENLWDDIKDKLASEEKHLTDEKKQLDELENNYSSLNKELENAKNNNANIDKYEKAHNAYQIVLDNKDKFDKIDDSLRINKEIKPVVDKYIELDNLDKKHRLNSDKIEQLDIEIQDAKIKKEELDQKYLKAEERHNNNAELKVTISHNTELIAKINRYTGIKTNINNAQKEIDRVNKAIGDKNGEIEKKDSEYQKVLLIANQDPQNDKYDKLLLAKNNAEKALEDIKNKKSLVVSFIANKSNLDAMQILYQLKVKQHEEASKKHFEYENKYYRSLAGILASDLEDGTPCPVCGSIHHPKKALLTEELSKAELDRLKGQKEEALIDMNKTEKDFAVLKSNYDNDVEQLEKVLGSSFNPDLVEAMYDELVQIRQEEFIEVSFAFNRLEDTRKDIEDNKKKAKELEQDISSLKGNINNLEKEKARFEEAKKNYNDSLSDYDDVVNLNIADINKKNNELQQEILQNENQYQIIKAEKETKDKKLSTDEGTLKLLKEQYAEEEQELSNLQKEADTLLANSKYDTLSEIKALYLDENTVIKLEQELSDYRVDLASKKSVLASMIEASYDKLVRTDLEELDNKCNGAKSKYDDFNNQYSEKQHQYKNNKDNYEKLVKAYDESKVVINEYNEVKQLYDVTSGKTSTKLNFEVYYQQKVFNNILLCASKKFNLMSGGRYELLPGASKGGNGQSGLEIDVKDLYNGEIRPVSGLSGGESFQASMALALSLSEVIQKAAGGIELNSMFIDEGFGTLDADMLNSTRNMLLGISSTLGRKIGIISHVDELERSIPSKIIVTKSNTGSNLKIVNE